MNHSLILLFVCSIQLVKEWKGIGDSSGLGTFVHTFLSEVPAIVTMQLFNVDVRLLLSLALMLPREEVHRSFECQYLLNSKK